MSVLGVFCLLALITSIGALEFDLGPEMPELCLSEDAVQGTTLKGVFNVPDPDDSWDTSITLYGPSPANRVLYSRQNVDNAPSDFTVPVTEDGLHRLCVTPRSTLRRGGRRGPGGAFTNTRRISLTLSDESLLDDSFVTAQAQHVREVEDAARNQAVPSKEQLLQPSDLKPINMLLLRTEAQLERLKAEFRDLRQREAEHRNTNESTNTRSVWLSMLTIGALVVLAASQLLYMRHYFRKKKLI